MTLSERIILEKSLVQTPKNDICHRLRIKLEQEKEKAIYCFPIPSSNKVLQVQYRLGNPHVNLNNAKYKFRKMRSNMDILSP